MQRLAPIAVALGFLLVTGVAHGLFTDRWSTGTDLAEAVARFDRLALNVGEWEGEDLNQANTPNTGLAGLLSRRYVHKSTGKTVTILLGVGRAGAVSIHTPDVCYAASGFEERDLKEHVMPADSAAPGAVFNRSLFVKTKAADQMCLRIYWAWYADGKWQTAKYPRFAFAGRPVLHKLYVVRELSAPNETADGEPCLEFMNALLPHLERAVLKSEPEA